MLRFLRRVPRRARRQAPNAVSLALTFALLVAAFPASPVPIRAALSDMTQQDYRWYDNTYSPPDKPTPDTPLAAENTAITDVGSADVLHLRMNVHSGFNDDVPETAVFKLQFSTSTSGPWTDVGGLSSGEIWRGFDNASFNDGDQIPDVVLSASAEKLTYEEANNAPLLGAIGKEKVAEWAWVLEENSAALGTSYYFRVTQSDGTALSSYTNYPQLTTAAPSLDQNIYRFYQNADAIQPTTALAAENTAVTNVSDAEVLRVRMSVQVSGVAQPSGEAFKLQYSTSTGGPWTDVGGIGSGETWRGFDNSTPADGATITSALLSGATVLETYEEANNSAPTPNAITVGAIGEWDWVVQHNGAAASTTYFFRMVDSGGAAFDTYTNYPELATAAGTTLAQEDYRWYANTDAIQPTAALAAENTALADAADGTVYRIRMSVGAAGTQLDAGEQFKLQHATSTSGPWTDVGGVGSGEIWRGFDNPTPADGATITANLLAGATILETYEEANNSAATPNAITVGPDAEWDWVAQNNGAAATTTYFFRMVKSTGTALDSYTNYPEIATATPVLTQDHYRWYDNADVVQPTTPNAAEDTAATAVADTTVLRLRMSVADATYPLAAGELFKLQYATSTSGPWSDVGGLGSGEIWRGSDNATPADGATISANLLSGATVLATYEEANNSAATPNAVTVGASAEWDWVVQHNGAALGTTYFFRMVKSSGAALDSYGVYPELATEDTVLGQADYRWHTNADDVQPGSALAAENAPITSTTDGTAYRVRINAENTGASLAAGQTYKLQFSTSTSGPWTDMGGIGSGEIWRGFDNPAPADGATVSSAILGSSTVLETYEEANNSAPTPNAIANGDFGEWDWVVQQNGADIGTTYFFRMVESGGTALSSYANYPQATTSGPLLTQEDYRWYQNTDGLQPTVPLAATNTAHTDSVTGDVLRLRVNASDADALLAAGETFKLQFATSTSGPWTDVGGLGSGETWRGFDNGTPADGAALSAALLGSDVLQTYEETNPSAATPNAIGVGQTAEWDWVVENNDALGATTYFFRMVKSTGAALDSYTNYPEVTTRAASLDQKNYRWYDNTDAVTPTTPKAAENTAATGVTSSDVSRIRLSIEVSDSAVAAGETFKLQFATSTSGPWTDVGGLGSGEIWRGFNNPSVSDGATLPSTVLSGVSTAQTYEEANNATAGAMPPGTTVASEWDWVVQDNNAAPSTTYFFRMVKSSGTALDSYTNYPEITTDAATLTQNTYRWYQNANAVQPTVALAAENTAASSVAETDVVRIRLSAEASAPVASGQTLKLQYATSTGGPWVDLGGIGSGEIWRGFDNPAPADGATITSALLSTADTLETYEESNNSAATPNTILQGTNADGEWDWVVQNNGAAASTTYFFRMVDSGGAALDGYNNYPELATAAVTLTQEDYRWYQNTDAIQPTVALAAENTALADAANNTAYRIRMSVGASGTSLPAGEQLKLQHATSTSGPWTDVGGIGSGEIWRGFDNATPTDGATIASALLAGATILETYEEENNSAATPNAITVGADAEWDWVVQNNGAAATTTYFFRMVKSTGAALDAYTNYPEIATATPVLTQDHYRWYDNVDAIQPSTPQAAEDTTITDIGVSAFLRLRMSVQGSAYPQAAGQTYKLQFATSTSGPWTDVGGLGSGVAWRGFDNASPADGATITANLLAGATILETYEETNNSAPTPNALTVGNSAEWDWVIERNGGATSSTYYFRMAESAGTALDSYSVYPALVTSSGGEVLEQVNYRWYANADSLTPGAALAAEATAAIDLVDGTPYHLRMNVANTVIDLSPGPAFKLQYSDSTSGPWTDVGAIGSGEIWRGYDNPTPADGTTLSSTLLTGATIVETYEEANDSAPIPTKIDKDKAAEWAWIVQPNGPLGLTTYYFRMVRDNGTPLDTYTDYPTVITANYTPDVPASLGPAQFIDNDTGWTTDDTPILTFTLSDPDTTQQVRYQVRIATDSGFTAIILDFTRALGAQGAASYTVGQAGGTYATGSVSMTLSDSATGYFWQVQAIDDQTAVSGYADAGAPGTADIRVDDTPPTAGTVADGPSGPDIAFNDGSLTEMSANWTAFADVTSGIATYEYSVGTSTGATDIRDWTTVGASTTTTDSGLVLHTGQIYVFNVRATDIAGNTMVTSASSDGQVVLPTLTVSTSSSAIQLGNFNPENDLTQIRTATVTVDTNAFNGFVILMYSLSFLRSVDNPAVIIPDFSGTYAAPAEWGPNDTGWGYGVGDCDVNGGLFWTGSGGPPCNGNAKYARITQSSPGDVVGDHTALVTGATGAVVGEEFTITLRATTTAAQQFADYATSLVFIVVPSY